MISSKTILFNLGNEFIYDAGSKAHLQRRDRIPLGIATFDPDIM